MRECASEQVAHIRQSTTAVVVGYSASPQAATDKTEGRDQRDASLARNAEVQVLLAQLPQWSNLEAMTMSDGFCGPDM